MRKRITFFVVILPCSCLLIPAAALKMADTSVTAVIEGLGAVITPAFESNRFMQH